MKNDFFDNVVCPGCMILGLVGYLAVMAGIVWIVLHFVFKYW